MEKHQKGMSKSKQKELKAGYDAGALIKAERAEWMRAETKAKADSVSGVTGNY